MLSAGCADTASPGARGAVTVDTFVAEYVPAACAALFACPPTDEDTPARIVFESPARCVERLPVVAAAQFDDLLASLRAGRVRLDGAAARRCFDRIATRCAAQGVALTGMCAEALSGTVASGEPCWRSLECVAGTWCDHGYAIGSRNCPGTCRPQLEPGRVCTSARECAASLGRAARCQGGRCVEAIEGADAAEGAPCGAIALDADTVREVGCAAGLYCATTLSGVSTCRPILTEGETCTRFYGCASGLTCLGYASTPVLSCRRLNVVDDPGGPCDPLWETGHCNPLAGLVCGAARTCERAGDGTRGARCPPGALTISCQAGLACDTVTMTCQPVAAEGAACRGDTDCASGQCGDGPTPRCLARICD